MEMTSWKLFMLLVEQLILTHHFIIPHVEILVDLGVMKMDNNKTFKIVSHDDVHIVTYFSCKLVLKNMHHISDLKLNLMSTSVLENKGYVSQFSCELWKLVKGSLMAANCKR